MVIFKKAIPFDPFRLLRTFTPQQAASRLLNSLLHRQPAVLALLAHHPGQSFELKANPINARLTIAHDGELSPADPSILPDVTLSIDTDALLKRGWRPGQPLPRESGYVHITGDAALAQTLSKLAEAWRPDIEDLLSQYIGDIPARQVVTGAARLHQLAWQGVRRASENLAEYAVYEADLLASPAMMQENGERQAHLVAHLDSLEKRLARIEQRTEAHRGQAQRSES